MPISTEGLVFWAPLTDGFLTSGRPRDISTNGNDSDALGGTPTFSATGMECLGGTENARYPISTVFDELLLTIAWRITPDFETNADATVIFWDTTTGTGDRYQIGKLNNAASNVLRVILAGTTIVSVAEGTWSPVWNKDVENTMILTANDTGNLTNMWLNGTQIVTNNATAWAKGDPTQMFHGSSNAGGNGLGGELRDFMMYSRLWSASDRAVFDGGGNPNVSRRTLFGSRGRTKGIVRSR